MKSLIPTVNIGARTYLASILILLALLPGLASAQCNVAASLCQSGQSQPFNFIPTTGAYAGNSFVNAGCNTGAAGNHAYGFITLYITQSGPLNLLINGNSNVGFVDVAIFNIPQGVAPCTAILNPANILGCNYASNSGGCVQFGNAFGCNSPVPAPNVVAGQQIMIIAQNWSVPGSNNFTLQLGPPPGAQSGPPNPTINPSGPFCVSSAPVQLTAVNQGGNWSGPGVSPTGTFNPAAAGPGTHTINYSIGVNPCNASSSTTITVNAPGSLSVTPSTSICAGGSTTLTATGAATYSWSPATGLSSTTGATVTASPTTTTTYTVTGTTAGCSGTATTTVTISPPLTLNAASATICNGSSATLTASGATDYTWSPATGLSATTGASVTASPAVTTTYTITGSTGACTGTTTSTVTVEPSPVVAVAPVTICTGGSGTLTASGADSYTWSPATGLSATTGSSVTASPATTTTYTVTGAIGACTGSNTVVVTVSPLPLVTLPDATICAGSSAILTASGADTYTWSPAIGLSAATGNPVTANPGATTTYTVTGTTNGCVSEPAAVTVTVNPIPTVDAGPDQSVCTGGAVTLTSSGAATFTWDNGITDGVAFTPAATAVYTVTTTVSGCTGSDQVTVTVNPLPAVNAGPDQSVCDGQPVTLAGSGASTYTWDNSVTDGTAFVPAVTATYTVTGTDANGCVNTDDVLVTITALPGVSAGPDQVVCTGNSITLSGTGAATYTWDNGVTDGTAFIPAATNTYTVTGTTANGCVNTDEVLITVAPLPVVDGGQDIVICEGESVTLSGSGASAYTWNNGVTDATAFSPAATATYTVTGTDGNGCVDTDQVLVTVNALPLVNAGPDQTICINAPVTLSGSGATDYAWDNGVTDGAAFNPATTMTYTVTGTDANGCVNTDQVEVTVNPLPVVSAGADQTICLNDDVTLSGSGAVDYAWNNSVTNATVFNPTATMTYTVTGTDANGCVNTDEVTVTVNPLPVVNAGTDQTICINDPVTLAGAGASTYTWDNGVTDETAFNPTATTTYTVTGTDANGCVNTDQVVVTVNPLPAVNAGADQTICINAPVTLSGSGASSYTWNNAVTNGTVFQPTATATYTVTGTDLNGCVNTDQVTITVNPLPVVNAGQDIAVCPETPVTLTATGAETYAWTNTVTNGNTFVPVSTTIYTVTGTDTNGCVNTDQVMVTVHALPPVNAGNDRIICDGESTILTATGAASYAWDNNVVNGVPFVPSATMLYTVTGTSAEGCVATDEVTVQVSPVPIVAFQSNLTSGCVPFEVTFTATSSSYGGTCEWIFGDGSSGGSCGIQPHVYNSVGCFDVTLITTSADGCIGQQTYQDLVCGIPYPEARFTPEPAELSLVNSYSTMINNSVNATSYLWDFGDGSATSDEVSPYHMFPSNDPANYQVMLVAFNELGCTDTAYARINVGEALLYFVPNAFTPDGDQFNQTFRPVFTSGFDPYNYSFFVYNRWGQVVFESHDALVGWSGTFGAGNEIAQDGVYSWKIELKTTLNGERKMMTGHVSLIR